MPPYLFKPKRAGLDFCLEAEAHPRRAQLGIRQVGALEHADAEFGSSVRDKAEEVAQEGGQKPWLLASRDS